MKEIMYYSGYAHIKEDSNNYTGFHEYPKTDPELHRQYYGYRQLNQQSIEWNAYMSDAERQEIQFMCSDPDKEVEVLDWD